MEEVAKAVESVGGQLLITADHGNAGIDDTTELGTLRMEKTEEVVKKINLAVYVLRTDEEPTTDDMHCFVLIGLTNAYHQHLVLHQHEAHRQRG